MIGAIVTAVIAEAEGIERRQRVAVGGEAAGAKGGRRRRARRGQQIARGCDQGLLLVCVEAGELEARIGAAIGEVAPDAVQMELHLLLRIEDRADHPPDRLEPVDQSRHRIDEEAGLQPWPRSAAS